MNSQVQRERVLRRWLLGITVVGMLLVSVLNWRRAPEISLAALAVAAYAPFFNWRVGRLDAALRETGLAGLSAPEGTAPSVLEEALKWGFLGLLLCVGVWAVALGVLAGP